MDPAMQIEVAAMSNAHVLDEAAAGGDSDVQQFYRRCTLLLTGGTGFMGKQLLEKMFRVCDVSKVFLLVRPKKGKAIQDRVTEMLQDPCFDKVRKLKPDFPDKIFPIEGDVADIRLGLGDQDWEILVKEVDVIYHVAATTRFDESLRVATLINVRGTREALLLGRACRKLKSFVHVSTAYTQAVDSFSGQEVFEEFRTSPIPPKELIDLVENGHDDDKFTHSLLSEYPNTYTFCKAVAEDLVRSMSDGLPICIVRPGIVVSSYREPIPGWLEQSCAYGASGLLLGTGLGIIHVLLMSHENKLALVPCDYVNNAIIVAGKEASLSAGGDRTKIYAVSSIARNPMICGYFTSIVGNQHLTLYSPKSVYYYYFTCTTNRILFSILTLFMHILPAYFVDFICLIIGKERRMVKVYKKVYKMTMSLSYFTTNTWIFNDDNLQSLQKSLSKVDNTIFNFDIENIDWHEYLQIWVIGVRKYIIKDGLRDTIRATKRQFWWKIMHYILTVLYFYCLYKVFSVFLYFFKNVTSYIRDHKISN